MKMQIIGNPGHFLSKDVSDFVMSPLGKPRALDDFTVNIINLNSTEIWRNGHDSFGHIDIIEDFRLLSGMIDRSHKTSIIIIFPQNLIFRRYFNGSEFQKPAELKYLLDSITENIVSVLIPHGILRHDGYALHFEATTTAIEGSKYVADFHFNDTLLFYSPFYSAIITKSQKSNKVTSFKAQKRFIFTTLDVLVSEESAFAFLKHCGLLNESEPLPQWLLDYHILNDEELNDEIATKAELIKNAEESIRVAKEGLAHNNKYKSILHTSGDELVEVVFLILQKILDVDLSAFVDVKEADFEFDTNDGLTLIGEIKGENKNVSRNDIGQLNAHYLRYLDRLEVEGIEKNEIKQILIKNPLLKKPLSEREPVNSEQIGLANSYGSLIIETKTLLKMYEHFTNGELTTETICDILRNKTGLLTVDDLQPKT